MEILNALENSRSFVYHGATVVGDGPLEPDEKATKLLGAVFYYFLRYRRRPPSGAASAEA